MHPSLTTAGRLQHMQNMLIVLLILCLPIFVANSQPASISPAPSPSLSPDNSYMWIVQGNSSDKVAPNCSDLCVTQLNLYVDLQPCEGLSASEQWLYEPQSLSITSKFGADSNVKLCIDASNPSQLQLVSCSGSATQMWTYDNETMRFQGGNSSADGPSLYLMGQVRYSSDWGSGKDNYSLELHDTEIDNFASMFTIIPFTNPLLIVSTSNYATSSQGQNLIRNSGFEECNEDPGKGFTTIDNTQPLYLCSWYVLSNEVEYSGTNLWQPQEGTHSLHLNSAKIAKPASVVQRLPTKVGSNYTLGFYMAGNPDINCGDSNKTMKVQVNPSSLAEQELWFDVSKAGSAGKMNYMYVYPIGFTAQDDYVNLTFLSLTTGSCGPVIDNISVQEIQGPLPPLSDPHASQLLAVSSMSSGMPTYGKVLLGIAVAVLFTAIASLLIITMKKKKAIAKKNATMMGSMRSISKEKHDRWWASFKLEKEMGKFGDSGSGIMELTWKQIEKATKNFTTIVGEGGFSTVYRAEMADGRVGAVKMEKTRDRSRQIFKQELSVLCRLHHPNLVNCIGFCNEREEGILVFEYMAHGSLHHRLHPPAHQGYVALGWKKRMEVALQVAHALQYLHDVARPAVVHGDIKSANVLLDDNDNAKLCDFGFSSKAGPNSSVFHSTVASVKGSLGYLDPQYLKNGRLSSKSDVYSFGVLLIEIITGLHAFDMHRAEALTSFTAPYVQDMDMMELIVDARLSGKFDRNELKAMCNVARSCVQEDSASRPTMSEVVFQLSPSSTGLSSTTTDCAHDEDGNVSSSAVSETLEQCLYNSFDTDFATMCIQSSRAI